MARVFDNNTNKETDQPLDVHIEIDDMNDNYPQFSNPLQYTVLEKSNTGGDNGMYYVVLWYLTFGVGAN